jgi:hypothetical protein
MVKSPPRQCWWRLVTTDPLVLPDALGRRPGAGIGVVSSWIAFSVLPPSCAALQSAALQFFFLYLALSCELSGGAKPGGIVAEGHSKSVLFQSSELSVC